MSLLDSFVLGGYFAVCFVLATVAASRRKDKSATGYFLAGKSLPWYVVGVSYIGANLSTEHFIGMIGMSYLHGVALAAWEWNGVVTFSILAWFIIPLYYKRGFHTMPEFLEKRFDPACRYVFALLTVLLNVFGFLAAVLFAGGVAMRSLFGWDLEISIILLALVAGAYTIYGGLVSIAWTDLLHVATIFVSGFTVLGLGLARVGGWDALLAQAPEHFQLFLPADHHALPWPGVLAVIFSVNIWYTSTNQHIVQRLLAARSEWDAKMGIVVAGFIKITTPFMIVIPGIIAFVLFPNLTNSNAAYPVLIRNVLPSGLFGLLMAAMTAAILSTIDSVTHATSTIVTLDFYQRFLGRRVSEERTVLVGRMVSATVLTLATIVACFINETSRVFVLIQNLFGYIGPPAASVFIMGIFWRRANKVAALTTLVSGIPIAMFIESVVFPDIVFLYRMFVTWVICMTIIVVVSLLSKRPDAERVRAFSWSRTFLSGPHRRDSAGPGWRRDWRTWWGLYVALILSMYLYFGTL